MSFLNNLVNDFTHSGQEQQGQGQGYPPQQSYGQQAYPSQSYNGPPQVPPPWIAEWDGRDNRWIFINRETGQRTFEHPQQQYGGGGYGGGYGQEQRGEYYEQQPQQQQKPNHSGRNMALAGVAGLAGGALLMHEGENIKQDWDRDEERVDYDADRAGNYVENKFDNGVQDVEDAPEDVAGWAGRKTQEVEDIPQDIDRKWDNGVQDVEDVPEDIAGWAGREDGRVERFDDNVDNAYAQGRNEERYDDDRRDDNY